MAGSGLDPAAGSPRAEPLPHLLSVKPFRLNKCAPLSNADIENINFMS